jgi:8-oxo-dGTP diphosphatase
MKVRPAVVILENNHLLLMRYHYGGQDVYNLPGGNPDPGETLADTLVRELNEELGVHIEVGALWLMGEVFRPELGKEILHCVFAAQIVGGIPALNPAHTSAQALDWVPISKLGSLALYPQVGQAIQDVIFTQKWGQYIGKIPQQWY